MIKVYVDKSLNMPIGKLCAQVSHAVMKLALDRFYINEDKLVCDNKDSISWLNNWKINGYNFQIEYLENLSSDREELNQKGSYAHIYDQGRTCFNGNTTLTVIAFYNEVLENHQRAIEERDTELTDQEARQILLIDRSIDYSHKQETLVKKAAIASMLNLFSYLKGDKEEVYFEIKEGSSLKDWLIGSFAKVTLSLKGENKCSNAMKKVDEQSIPFSKTCNPDFSVFAFGPCRKNEAMSITKRMQLF